MCCLFSKNDETENRLNNSPFLQVTPSVYTQEMLQSTEERFANNKEITQPRILELLDMSKSSQHKVNLTQCFDSYTSLGISLNILKIR